MKTTLVLVTLVFCSFAFAQNHRKTLSTGPGQAWGSRQANAPLANCSGCAAYTGDFDPFSPLADGLRNGNEVGGTGIVAQVYVAATPTSDGNLLHKHFSATDITFNELATGNSDITGGTYSIAKTMSSGNGGVQKNLACKTIAASPTGTTGFGLPLYSITCKLKAPYKMAVGTQYFVNVLPKFSGVNYGFLANMEDLPPLNGYGWGDTMDNHFFQSAAFGANYAPAGNYGPFDEFSIGFTGSYVP